MIDLLIVMIGWLNVMIDLLIVMIGWLNVMIDLLIVINPSIGYLPALYPPAT